MNFQLLAYIFTQKRTPAQVFSIVAEEIFLLQGIPVVDSVSAVFGKRQQ